MLNVQCLMSVIVALRSNAILCLTKFCFFFFSLLSFKSYFLALHVRIFHVSIDLSVHCFQVHCLQVHFIHSTHFDSTLTISGWGCAFYTIWHDIRQLLVRSTCILLSLTYLLKTKQNLLIEKHTPAPIQYYIVEVPIKCRDLIFSTSELRKHRRRLAHWKNGFNH